MQFTGKREDRHLVEPGKYEVTLNSEWKESKTGGSDYIMFTYTIRNDVAQNEQGETVLDFMYKSKTTNDFPASKINSILAAIPDAKLDFADYDELVQYFNDVNMIIEVQIEKADPTNPNSKDRNVVKFWSNEPTVAGPVWKQKAAPVEDTSVKEGDLPF